jgi:FtsP/CotA-like multicopper oxidase with cupredoxin domain
MGAIGVVGTGVSVAFITNAFGAPSVTATASGVAPQPPLRIIRSEGGVLRGHLTLVEGDAWVAGDTASGLQTYDGLCPGPVLWAEPGDRVLLDVTNQLSEMTNTHFHGFHVTPEGAGDNVFAHVHPGETFHHDFVIPADHPGGLYWYHPHMHGLTNTQLYRGLAGLFVIGGGAAALPALADKTHVLMGIRNTAIAGTGPDRELVERPSAEEIQTVNGATDTMLEIAPGETQLWQIGNLSNEAYVRLQVDGHPFTVVAEDGHLLWRTYETDQILMPPGKRFEVAVTGGPPGAYAFRQLGYVEGAFGDWRPQVLGTLTSAGDEQVPAVIPAEPAPRDDLADEPIAQRRTITMSERDATLDGQGRFFMNDVLFQDITPADVIQATLGTTEEWVIRNDPSIPDDGSPEDHPFHLHVNHMVLTGTGTWDPTTGAATSYEAIDAPGKVDTVNVRPGEYVVVRVKFEDFTGSTVYHCHILEHEDKGMMGVIAINPAPEPVVPAAPVEADPTFSG